MDRMNEPVARSKIVGTIGVLFVGLWLMPAAAWAQNTGIAGVVRDSSGGVLPGVTVEASSPALIEKVRTVVTDGQGLYSIVDLRPGTYTVTFTLPGFSTVRREGIELTTSFTATVNAELTVGGVQETITVSGEAPTVDTRNVVQAQVLGEEIREAVPTARSAMGMAELIPGITVTAVTRPTGVGHDVVGVADARGAINFHGSKNIDNSLQLDGTQLDKAGNGTTSAWQAIPSEVREYVYEVAAMSAETMGGGVRVQVVPKEGGNRFSLYAFSAFTNPALQRGNLSQKLIDLGVPTPNELALHWDADFAIGGPIKRDRLWFFSSYRNNGEHEQVTGMYQAIDPESFVFDPSKGAAGNVDPNKPAFFNSLNVATGHRLTWQATQRNKLLFYFANQPRLSDGTFTSGTRAYESSIRLRYFINWVAQVAWKAPVTPRLLIETNVTHQRFGPDPTVPSIKHTDPFKTNRVQVNDLGTGFHYRSTSYAPPPGGENHSKPTFRAAVSYVTGAHVAKFGVLFEEGILWNQNQQQPGNMTFNFQNGVPISLVQHNRPNDQRMEMWNQGFFAQDQWTIKRLTLNGGIRLDFHQGSISDKQTSGPNQFVGFQRWPQIDNVPDWSDFAPRMGVAYDLFGNGRTALKFTLNRYVVNDGTGFQTTVNPLLFNQTTSRPWTDGDGDFVPDCDLSLITANGECGSVSNSAFATGRTTTRVDDAYRVGWHVRPHNWETSGGVQHELLPQLSVSLAYTRREYGNFTVTDNRAHSPADYDEFCITAPSDSRLGSVSGTRICGLYDLNPVARARTPDNLVTSAAPYGEQTEGWQGIDLLFNARLPRGITLTGGLNSGTEGNFRSNCFVVDSPQQLRFCDVSPPWLNAVRAVGIIPLPWDITFNFSYLSNPGPQITADYSVRNAQIGSIVQFLNPARTTFSGGSATVPLLSPGTTYNERLHQVDIRLAKIIRHRAMRYRLTLDLGNLFNASTILTQNNAYGPNWLRPSQTLPGLIVKPGLLVEF